MATWNLYIDIGSGRLVTSPTDSTAADPPPLVQGDTPTWRIWLLQPTGAKIGSLFNLIQTAGLTLQVAIGTRVGNASSYYTQQFTWTASGSTVEPYWEANVPLNTAAITTLLGANSSAGAYLEVKYFQNSLPTTVLELPVLIQAAVIKDGGASTVPPGLNAATVEYVNATFLPREVTGPIILVHPTTGAKMALYIGDDNQFHADPLTV